MNIGKQTRISRIIRPETSRTVIIPLDHGMTIGAVEGIEKIKDTVDELSQASVDAVLMHKGLVRQCSPESLCRTPLILHLSASSILSPSVNTKRIVTSVEEAIRLGADAVSIHVNIGSEGEGDMLADAGKVAEACEMWGMPLMMMMYARGPKITNQYHVDNVRHCARIAAELGADIVKVGYTGDIESFSRVVEECCVPVVIAGGDKMDSLEDILSMVHDSLIAGGSGLSIGRNVFQCKERVTLCKSIHALVHDKLSLEAVLEPLKIKMSA